MTRCPTRGCVSSAVTPRTASIAFAAPCAPWRDPGVAAQFCSSVEIRLTLSPSQRADGNIQRRWGLRLLLLVRGAKHKVNERIAAQLAQCTTVPVAEVVCLPESSLMAHWPPLLLPPVLAWGSSTSLGEIRTIAMVPPFSLHVVLGARRRVWSRGTVVRTSPPITHRSRQPTTR